MRLTAAVCLIVFLSGCVQVGDHSTDDKTTSTIYPETQPEASLKESCPTLPLDCVMPPNDGCTCREWSCRAQSTAATSLMATTTTCVMLPDEGYTGVIVRENVLIDGGRFRPSNLDAYVGDVVFVNITSRQGLHRIRDTFSNNTMVIGPGESQEIVFQADREGVYLLTCNPYCEEPMEATITLKQPYREVC